jgi:DNA-binding transcriptional LysR family regulator
MTLEQLRIFVAVAKHQHVTHAAAELHLTQSAVSSAIAALEARHDVRLFDRVGRNIVLNQTGTVFLAEARAVLARAVAAETALDDLGGLKRGRLSTYASQTIACYWLPERLVAFQTAYPGIEIDVQTGNTSEAAQAVIEGSAELALVEGDVDDPVLSRQTIGRDQLVVLVGASHPWAKRTELATSDLARSPWVMREVGSGTRAWFEATLKARGVDPATLPITLTLPASEAILSAVEAGAGATVLASIVARASLLAGGIRQAPYDLPARPYYLLRHKERFRSKAGDAFVSLIERFERDLNLAPPAVQRIGG